MFENMLRYEIKTNVAASLLFGYNNCIEIACTLERSAPKPKVKEIQVLDKVKTKYGMKEKDNQKKPWTRSGKKGNDKCQGPGWW